MRTRRPFDDPNQLGLWDDCELVGYVEASQRIHELANRFPEPCPAPETEETEAEFYIELAAAARQAVKGSGFSREQVLDRINLLFGRSGDASDDKRRPVSIHMFNNYLSKPHESRLPVWMVHAIAVVCASDEPVRPLLRPGSIIVGAEEQTELLLGKVDRQIRDMQSLKRTVSRQLRARRAGTNDFGRQQNDVPARHISNKNAER